MRTLVCVATLLAGAGVARADKQLDDLRTGYTKEAAGCKVSSDGVRKVADGAAELAKAATAPDDRAALASDLDKLEKGAAVVQGYCAELAGAIDAIASAPAGTTYKKLERALDERDNRIRKARAASKKTLAELEPISHRLIPRINAARVAGNPPPAAPKTPAKFPSGHVVELPAGLPGQWKISGTAATDTADYADKTAAAFVTVRAFAKATCDQQKQALAGDKPTDLELPGARDRAELAWVVGFTRGAHVLQVACVSRGDGGFVGTLDATPIAEGGKLAGELQALMLRMLAAQ